MTKIEKVNQFRTVIVETLVGLGWVATDGINTFAVAQREYDTLAGPNTCLAWFNPFFDCPGRLSAQYVTEGENILTASSFSTGLDMSPEEVMVGTKAFAAEVEEKIRGTRMVRNQS
ncbi:hypothetical protein [Microbulbifer epialgicus]|uniref:Uncharacterized protein n=1 Tax=Microbulbifer epialgicus TaxID=393907 RepID=A0ABV4NTC8_9GAMM